MFRLIRLRLNVMVGISTIPLPVDKQTKNIAVMPMTNFDLIASPNAMPRSAHESNRVQPQELTPASTHPGGGRNIET